MKTIKWFRLWVVVCILALVVTSLGYAYPVEVELSPIEGEVYEGIYEWPPNPKPIDWWVHVSWPGHEGEEFTIDAISLFVLEGCAVDIDWIVQIGDKHQISEWFEWATSSIDEPPCTICTFQADLRSTELGGTLLLSNKVPVHVVPEPTSLFLLGSGLFGLSGAILRKHRKKGSVPGRLR